MYKYPIVYLNKFYHCNTILADFVVPRSRCSGSRNKKIKNQNPKHNWDIKVSLETYIKSMTYIFRTWARWRSLNPWRIWCVICHATILNSVHLQRSRKLFDKMLGICMSVCAACTLCTIHLLLLDRDHGVECICQQWATNIYLLATIDSSKKEVHNRYLHLFSSQCGQILFALYSVWWVQFYHLKAIEICYIIEIQRSWDYLCRQILASIVFWQNKLC
jgi:hypothetical protein